MNARSDAGQVFEDEAIQFGELERFADVGVGSGLEAPEAVLGHGESGQGDDPAHGGQPGTARGAQHQVQHRLDGRAALGAAETQARGVRTERGGAVYLRAQDTLQAYPERMTDRLVHWAQERPDQTWMARRGPDGQWIHITYAQAWAQAQAIGQALLDHGLSVERPLAILSENSLEHALLALGALLGASAGVAQATGTLRIAMTASDIPLPNGQTDQGAEGMRFMGYTVFEALVAYDLSSADKPNTLIPGLATDWQVDGTDKLKWTFKLRPGVKFHDGSAFTAQSVAWNFDKILNNAAPQFDPKQAAQGRSRIPSVKAYRAIDDRTFEIITFEGGFHGRTMGALSLTGSG